MSPAEIQQAAEAMQTQIEEALHVDADTEVAACAFDEWTPGVMLTDSAVKQVVDVFEAAKNYLHANELKNSTGDFKADSARAHAASDKLRAALRGES